jgi:uncharacterized protein (DUF58 family)
MAWLKNFFPHNRFFVLLAVLCGLFVLSYTYLWLLWPAKTACFTLLAFAFTDALLLFRFSRAMEAYRIVPEKLSNGDDNTIGLVLKNTYPFAITALVIDEAPPQFQLRNLQFTITLRPGQEKKLTYTLRPVTRGEYHFGNLLVYALSPLKLCMRRHVFHVPQTVPVYPAFLQMRRYELMAISNRLTEAGIKKIRRIGHNLEFELVREYVAGDDVRTINWKATARKVQLMVNQYQDERSQNVYSLIDKSRVMEMPFQGMTLLDYAINASLVMSNIALRKSDKAGLLTFQDKVNTFLPASRSNRQLATILEVLYNQKTSFREADFSAVYSQVRSKINQRSLLLLFTNFESIYGMERQLPFLRSLARYHLLVVIFFENTELNTLISQPARSTREIYHKSIAEKFALDKKLIVKTLTQNGIHTILTSPEKLTVNTLNKYLEFKARGYI